MGTMDSTYFEIVVHNKHFFFAISLLVPRKKKYAESNYATCLCFCLKFNISACQKGTVLHDHIEL